MKTREDFFCAIRPLMYLGLDSIKMESSWGEDIIRLEFNTRPGRTMLVLEIFERETGWYVRHCSTTMPATTEDYGAFGRAYALLSNPEIFGLTGDRIVPP